MQKRKLKWANIVGLMVFACALVLNIQTSLDGGVTIFQSGVAQTTGGTGSDGSGSEGSEGTGSDGSGGETPCVSCDNKTLDECQRVQVPPNEVIIYHGNRSACD